MMFEEIIGQKRALRILNNMSKRDFVQNLLFTGPAGVGKRTTALIFTRNLNCPDSGCGVCHICQRITKLNFPDLHLLTPIAPGEDRYDRSKEYMLGQTAPSLKQNEIINIDHVRDIITECHRPPVEGRRVVIIVHAHRMRYEAVSALLKVIEEQPHATTFIITSPQLSAVPDTIKSRCQIVRFNYLKEDEVFEVVKKKGLMTRTIVPGSPGETIRFFNSRYFQLTREIFLKTPLPERRIPSMIRKLRTREHDFRELIQNLLNWYQLLLYARLNPILISDDDIIEKVRKTKLQRIIRSIETLLKLNIAIDFHPNRNLLLFRMLRSLC